MEGSLNLLRGKKIWQNRDKKGLLGVAGNGPVLWALEEGRRGQRWDPKERDSVDVLCPQAQGWVGRAVQQEQDSLGSPGLPEVWEVGSSVYPTGACLVPTWSGRVGNLTLGELTGAWGGQTVDASNHPEAQRHVVERTAEEGERETR